MRPNAGNRLLIPILGTLALSLVVTGAYASWTFDTYFGNTGQSAQFVDVDSQGDVWVTDYGTPGVAGCAIFSADGATSTFLTQGQINGAPYDFSQSGGVAADTANGVVYVTGRYSPAPLAIFKFNDLTNAPEDGIYLGALPWSSPGDIDLLTSGTNTYLAMVDKVAARWGLLDTTVTSPTAYVADYGVAGFTINRGLGVNDATKTVYIASETDDAVHTWGYSPSSGWSQGPDLEASTGGNESACEVDSLGNIFVSKSGLNTVSIYDSGGTLIEDINTDLTTPRGTGFGPGEIYVAQFTSAAPMVAKFIGSSAVHDWVMY